MKNPERSILKSICEDDRAEATVEWLLVAGASLLLSTTVAFMINTVAAFIFTRNAIVISMPFG